MTTLREQVPLHAADISTFCKQLRAQLAVAASQLPSQPPSHLALLNMLARSAGFRNYQALRAGAADVVAPPAPTPAPPPAPIKLATQGTLSRAAWRTLGHFDTHGRLQRWPTQYTVQQMALWGLWVRLSGQRDMTENEINRALNAFHTFGDMATLRRELVNAKLLWRERDCSRYRKLTRTPDADTRAFLDTLLAETRQR